MALLYPLFLCTQNLLFPNVNLNRLTGLGKFPSLVLCMLVHKFLCNVNDTRTLIGLCLLVMSQLGQIRDPWHSQAFTVAHTVIGLSLQIRSFIHLSFKSLFSFSHVICFSFRPHWSLSPSDITVRSNSSLLASLHLTYIVIGLSLDIHSFIHLRFKSLSLFSFM